MVSKSMEGRHWGKQNIKTTRKLKVVLVDKIYHKKPGLNLFFHNHAGWGDVGPRGRLVYLRGKSHITLLTACHREVINYLSKSHQSVLWATATLKLTHNLARKRACTNMYSTQRNTQSQNQSTFTWTWLCYTDTVGCLSSVLGKNFFYFQINILCFHKHQWKSFLSHCSSDMTPTFSSIDFKNFISMHLVYFLNTFILGKQQLAKK